MVPPNEQTLEVDPGPKNVTRIGNTVKHGDTTHPCLGENDQLNRTVDLDYDFGPTSAVT